MELNKIYQGNSLTVLKTFPDEHVHCVITSPPYFSLRSYSTASQIWDGEPECKHEWGTTHKTLRHRSGETNPGLEAWFKDKGASNDKGSNFCLKCSAWRGSLGLEPSIDLYIKHLCDIFDGVKRVLRKDGTLFVVISDTYSGSHQGFGKDLLNRLSNKKTENLGSTKIYLEKYKHTINQPPPSSKTSVPDKCLCMVPFRFALEMVNRGWILRNDIIWHKPNCMPSSVADRFTVDFEHVFFFVRSPRYYFKQQFEPFQKSSLLRAQYGSYSKKTDMGIHGGMTLKTQLGAFKKIKEGKLPGRNKRCVWAVATQSFKGKHWAVYPSALIEPLVSSGSPVGGVILDPFMGSGTTGLVTLRLNRKFVGIELNKNYVEMAKRRIRNEMNGRT